MYDLVTIFVRIVENGFDLFSVYRCMIHFLIFVYLISSPLLRL